MVIYIEACESGSMFDSLLPPDIDGKLTYIEYCINLSNLTFHSYTSQLFNLHPNWCVVSQIFRKPVLEGWEE